MTRRLFVAAVACFATSAALAQPVAVCALQPGPTQTVARVIDGETIALADGTEIRLIGAMAPRASDGGARPGTWAPEAAARSALEALVMGRTVEIGFAGRRSDRHGRLLGHAFVRTDIEPVWVQGRMLGQGHARAYSLPESTACMDDLIEHERLGRTAGTGLWAVEAYAIRAAERTAELLRLRSTFQIVEGRVAAVADSRGRVFVNFGRDYRNDFTIGMQPPVTRRMQEEGIAPKALEGRLVRVRGWIEARGGPFVELHHHHQIELLPEAAALVSPSRRASRRRPPR